MSKTSMLLVVSLALNVFLLALFAAPLDSSRAVVDTAASANEPLKSAEALAEAAIEEPALPDPRSPAGRAAARSAKWTQVLHEQVAQLRGHGLDEETVRLLVTTEAERLFRQRARQVLAGGKELEYWESNTQPWPLRGAALADYQRLRREKQAAILELFGEEYASTLDIPGANTFLYADRQFSRFDYLPADKRLEVIEYLETAAGTAGSRRSARAARSGTAPYADELKAEQDIRLILGSALFEEYLRRSSNGASQLRDQLTTFRPTRAEFDALLGIEREFRIRASEPVATSADPKAPMQKYASAQEQKNEAIRSLLGDVRYAEYERTTDWSFRHLDSLTREMGLDPGIARSAYARVEQARARVAKAMSGSDMRDAAAQAAVQAAVNTARRELQARLVEDFGLHDLSEQEAQSMLGPVMNIWPQRGAFGYSVTTSLAQ